MKVSTNWLKDFVTLAPPLERLAERLTLAGLEVKKIEPRSDLKDTVFEVEVTTNRPDWLSHWGVAREIHAVENTGLKTPPFQNPAHRPMPSGWKLDLREAEGCPYYTACLIEGVQMVETPDWMRNRLSACGVRSVNLVVDITNYVLLEIGQPLHAFDADLITGSEVVIRRAKPGEAFTAINGTRCSLSAEDLVIADRSRPVALAGVMGGSESEVSARTRNILLESAFFHPRWVRKTSLRHGLGSESSYRFERRVDPEGVDIGSERAAYLFRELACPRNLSAVLKAGRKPTLEKSRIHLSLEQVRKILGMEVKPHEVHSALTRLALEVRSENPGNWVVGIPSYRPDLVRPVDLVEEVARINGYEKVPEVLPERSPVEAADHPLRELEERTRNFFAGQGLYETVTFSLVTRRACEAGGFDLRDSAEINNPIHQELTVLRPSFGPSLTDVAACNERLGARSVAIFEVGNLYSRKGRGGPVLEQSSLGVLLAGSKEAAWSDPKRPFNFFDVKGLLENYFESIGIVKYSFQPWRTTYLAEEEAGEIKVDGERIGLLGALAEGSVKEWDLHTRAFFAEINLEVLLPRVPRDRKCGGLPRFPAIGRDLSVIVDEKVTVGEISDFIAHLGKGLIRAADLFDLFRGGRIPAGQKNLAFRLTYQSLERTLLSEEIQKLHEGIAAEVAKKFQARFQQK